METIEFPPVQIFGCLEIFLPLYKYIVEQYEMKILPFKKIWIFNKNTLLDSLEYISTYLDMQWIKYC